MVGKQHSPAITYINLLEELMEDDSTEIRRQTLPRDYNRLQHVASKVGCTDGNMTETELLDALAAAGCFRGGVGDDRIYQYDADNDTVEVVDTL